MKQGFFISKKEHKRNLKKPHKWRVQAICGDEKKSAAQRNINKDVQKENRSFLYNSNIGNSEKEG